MLFARCFLSFASNLKNPLRQLGEQITTCNMTNGSRNTARGRLTNFRRRLSVESGEPLAVRLLELCYFDAT